MSHAKTQRLGSGKALTTIPCFIGLPPQLKKMADLSTICLRSAFSSTLASGVRLLFRRLCVRNGSLSIAAGDLTILCTINP